MSLARSNYHSQEANMAFMSVSQFKDFVKCEAMALAKAQGQFIQPTSKEFLVGSYVHAWAEGPEEFERFKKETPGILSRKGEPYAEFALADKMIEVLDNDEFCRFILQGQSEVIMTGEFAGVQWKIRMDKYNPEEGYFLDLKTTRNITELVWDDRYRTKVSFLELYDYPIQAAVYAEIEKLNTGRDKWLDPLILAVSKEDPPDKAIISLYDPDRLTSELENIKNKMPRIIQVKSGEVNPIRCGKCAYCRSTKKLHTIMNYRELELGA